MLPDSAISRLYDLNIGTPAMEDGPFHESTHKPLILIAALDFIDQGIATPITSPPS